MIQISKLRLFTLSLSLKNCGFHLKLHDDVLAASRGASKLSLELEIQFQRCDILRCNDIEKKKKTFTISTRNSNT